MGTVEGGQKKGETHYLSSAEEKGSCECPEEIGDGQLLSNVFAPRMRVRKNSYLSEIPRR